ncbi:MAG: VOC family protein [Myxococcota bacterium]
MVGYVCIGASDFERSVAWYLELLGPIGAKRMMDLEGFTLIGKEGGGASIAVTRPFNGEPQSAGNGMMVALQVANQEEVNGIYERAIATGGSDEGPPGDRGGIFYAAYFRDIDGNKLNAYCFNR